MNEMKMCYCIHRATRCRTACLSQHPQNGSGILLLKAASWSPGAEGFGPCPPGAGETATLVHRWKTGAPGPTWMKNNMFFNRTLLDWSNYDINNRTRFDATVSSGFAIMANQGTRNKMSEKRNQINLNFAKYSNKGFVSEIIK